MFVLHRYTSIWLKFTSAECDSLITDEIYDDTDIEMSTLELLRHVFFFTLKVYWLPRFMLHSCPLNSKRRLKLGELTCIFLTSMQLEISQFWARYLCFVFSKMFDGSILRWERGFDKPCCWAFLVKLVTVSYSNQILLHSSQLCEISMGILICRKRDSHLSKDGW